MLPSALKQLTSSVIATARALQNLTQSISPHTPFYPSSPLCLMQQPPPAASNAHSLLAPDAIHVAVRSSGGDGSRVFVVEAPARGTIADVKRLLCIAPHSVCSEASELELVLKGEGAAVEHAPLFVILLTCISRCGNQAASCAMMLRSHQLLQRRA